MSSPIVITARHLLKTAPSVLYSAKRSRRPSRPSVTSSPGQNGKRLRAEIDLDARMDALVLQDFTSGVPSAAFWRIVSS